MEPKGPEVQSVEPTDPPVRTAILSLGEMGGAIAELLIAKGWPVATCLDCRSDATRKRATAIGVECTASIASAIAGSDYIFSLVPPDAAVNMALSVTRYVKGMSQRPIYIDGNSISPMTLDRIDRILSESGITCVDGIFIGSSNMLRTKTIFYVSGPAAETVSRTFGSVFRTRVLGPSIGKASAFKLSMSGFNKGLVAIFLEMMSAANSIGLRDEMYECLKDFYPGTVETVERLLPTYPKHARRRAVEMNEVTEWFRFMGQLAPMAEGTRQIIERLSDVEFTGDEEKDFTKILDCCMQADFLKKK